ncbi:CHAT domain-containing protein [Streptomyces sp. NPDC088194]|uniref:CHAT domain-containing protein n=1 Tax=Streptomyces sp. NPDC088194 TaxID=3154931 RepID=UPI00344FAFC0
MTAQNPTPAPDENANTDRYEDEDEDAYEDGDELRAGREEILATLAATASDAPAAPVLCARAGTLSYRLWLLEGRPEDLELAAEAFGLAFRAPGDDGEWAVWRIEFGHVRRCQYEAEPRAELLDETEELLRDGISGLADRDERGERGELDERDGLARFLGLHLLAVCAKERFQDFDGPAERRAELLDEALRRYEEADGALPGDALPGDALPGDEEASRPDDDALELTVSRAYLHLERCEVCSDPADAAAAARLYGTVLDAAPPGIDLPFLRYSRALALLGHGRMTRDRAELELSRGEFDSAVLEATRTAGEAPPWAWEAEIRCAFIRFLIWATWKDQAHAAAAEVELAGLLADPADVDRLLPLYLDSFGRLLYERGGVRGDKALQDRAIALIRRAVDAWVPERDGPVTVTALLLAVFQQNRYLEDPDPRRLRDAAEGADLVLTGGQLDDDLRKMTQLTGFWAHSMLKNAHGVTLEAPDDVPEAFRLDGALAAYRSLLGDIEQGRTFLDFGNGDQGFPGMFGSVDSDGRRARAFDVEYARFRALESHEERAHLAASLLPRLMLVDPHGTHVTAAQKAELIDCVLSFGQDDPQWQRRAHAVAAQALLVGSDSRSAGGMDEVLDHLARAEPATGAPGGTDGRGLGIDLIRLTATATRGQTAATGDDGVAARGQWQRLRDDPRVTPYLRRMLDTQQAAVDAQAAAQRGDLAAADGHLAAMLAAHAALDPEDPSRIEVWTLLENARSVRDHAARTLGAPPAPPLVGRPSIAQLRSAAQQLPRDHRTWVLGDNAIARFTRAADRQDADALAEAMELLKEAHDLADEGSDSRLRYAHCLGSGHCALAEVQRLPTARARHLSQGIALLESAFALAGGPDHRLYALAGLALGRAYRTRGELRGDDRGAGRRVGLDALRGHAWAALLQSGTEHAAQAVVQATDTAFEVAGWCLRDNVPEQAVRALDACRGLVLHAATTSRTVPERLVAAGRDDLAAEWSAAGLGPADPADPLTAVQAPLAVPSSLRRRVLAALTGTDPVQDGLLDPPDPDEIAAALRTLRKDALVYLVPATDDTPGSSVVVTSTGAVHAVPLPTLAADAAALRDYVRAPVAGSGDAPGPGNGGLGSGSWSSSGSWSWSGSGSGSGRDLGPVPGHASASSATASLRGRLDRVCGWAWYAGMRPLLDVFATRTGRVPRLVLVPMGTLGLVPWHAAWRQGPDGRRRYALHDAEISYAASARLLCDVAARPPAAHTGAALVVGDPTGDLRYAGEEADAVQRAFYPRGRFLGHREGGASDGPGTPAEVLAWLTGEAAGVAGAAADAGAAAAGSAGVAGSAEVTESAGVRGGGGVEEGAVLHLACHAAISADTRHTAHLTLHGGELAAEDLTEATGATGGSGLGLVLLAACRSHVSGRGHNEAYSLATAFLVAGARSVIGSLWPVPDDATSVLMFLVHHYLRAEGEPPATALRRGQLWMLDPARELPASLPASLAERTRHIDPDDLSAWAGFTHLGQ